MGRRGNSRIILVLGFAAMTFVGILAGGGAAAQSAGSVAGANNLLVAFAQQDNRWLLDMVPATPMGPQTPVWGYRVVHEYPHDTAAFTEGLAFVDGALYEGTGSGTGSSRKSVLRRVDLATGEVEQEATLDQKHFGEGVAVVGERIYQLTWKTSTCFVYDRKTFEQIGKFSYQTEGWGLAFDGEQLVMSDGTSRLVFRDPSTFAEIGSIEVRDGDGPVSMLNELEYVGGEIWANVWQTNRIARIDPATGRVTGWIDLTGLLSPVEAKKANVLNGIAYDQETGRLFVTGKLWPALFEIELVAPPS